MIEVQGLTKFYGRRKAIDELTFSVSKGEILGFLGPNGAGKSTTMKILTCFMPASSGTAKVAGFDVFESPIEVKRRVGYLPETPPVYKEMVVRDYLNYKAVLHGLKGAKQKSAVDAAVEKCGLKDVHRRLIGNLSKGYRQRVGIAQAIVHNPDVLILDEPTVGLDPKQIIEIRDLVKSLRGDHTVILSTHILPEVEATCSRVLILNQGKIVTINTFSAISSQLKQGNTFRLVTKTKNDSLLKQIESLSGVSSIQELDGEFAQFQIVAEGNQDIREKLTEAVFKSGVPLLEFRREALSLEEVFLKLTTVETHTS